MGEITDGLNFQIGVRSFLGVRAREKNSKIDAVVMARIKERIIFVLVICRSLFIQTLSPHIPLWLSQKRFNLNGAPPRRKILYGG